MYAYPFSRSLLALSAILTALSGALCIGYGILWVSFELGIFYVAGGISGLVSAAILYGFSTVLALLTDIRNGVGAGRAASGPRSADCPGCGGRVSSDVAKCGHCGYRLK